MKKRKITYSPTAQQKKQQKRMASGETVEKKPDTVVEPTEEAVAISEKNYKRTIIICVIAIFLAVVMIVLAVVIPIVTGVEKINNNTFYNWEYFNPDDPDNLYTDDNPNPNPPANPIATITLTGDDATAFKTIFGKEEIDINIELFMDDAPYSSMNFIYLAESNFYDGTIIHDVNRGHAMFSGFTEAKNGANRANERNFVRNLTGFETHTISTWGDEDFKLGYRLSIERARTKEDSPSESFGYLIMMASNLTYGSSTTFMFVTNESPQFNFADGNTSIKNYLSWTGLAADDQSKEYMRKLDFTVLETERALNFMVPKTTIRIKDIKTNLSERRKGYLLNNFESLIIGAKEGYQSGTNWTDSAFNNGDNYYSFGF